MTRLYKWRFGKARFALLALGLLAFCALTAILLWEGRSPAEEAQKYYEHGAKLLEQRDYVKASIELRNAVRLKSDLLPAWHSLAQIDEATKNWPHLIARLQSIVSLDPSDTEARIKLARLLLFSGSVREALAATNMSNEAESRNGRLLGIKAAILYRLNYPVKAVQQAQDALGIEPNNPDALMVLAVD